MARIRATLPQPCDGPSANVIVSRTPEMFHIMGVHTVRQVLTVSAPSYRIVPHCPMCASGEMELSLRNFGLHMFVCLDCGSTLDMSVNTAMLPALRDQVAV